VLGSGKAAKCNGRRVQSERPSLGAGQEVGCAALFM
jgi:hypothetical protein